MLEAIKNIEVMTQMIPQILNELDFTFTAGSPIVKSIKSLEALLKKQTEMLLDEKDRRRNYAYKVKDMRRAQTAYFKHVKAKEYPAAGKYLKESKQYEAEVDVKTAEIIAGVEPQKIF